MHLIKSVTPGLGLGPEAESRKSLGGHGRRVPGVLNGAVHFHCQL